MAQATITGTYTAGQPARASDVSGDLAALAARVNEVTTEQIKDTNVTEGKIANAAVTTAKLANGVLSADTSGRAKMADGFLSADTAGRAKMADQFVNEAKLESSLASAIGQVAKAWALVDGTGTPSLSASYNVDSIVDNATGNYTLNWDTDFSSANYAVIAGGANHTAPNRGVTVLSGSQAAGSVTVESGSTSDASNIDLIFSIVAYGEQ